MQNGLFIILVDFFMFEDLIISKSRFLTMNLEFCYQKVHFLDHSVPWPLLHPPPGPPFCVDDVP